MDIAEFNFNAVFGRKWKNVFDFRFLKILATVFSLTIATIIYLANIDYDKLQEKLVDQIRQEYVAHLLDLESFRFKEFSVPIEVIMPDYSIPYERAEKSAVKSKDEIRNERKKIRDQMANDTDKQGILGILSADANKYDNLPDLSIDDDLALENIIAPYGDNIFFDNQQLHLLNTKSNRQNELDFDEEFDPLTYRLKRKGNTYLNPTEDILREKEQNRGWRDWNEITRVIKKHEPMIEYCFNREARNFGKLDGYITVNFRILHKGIVDPASVRIVHSSIKNRRIEQCIINTLRRWRDFAPLHESMGTVAVVQKFIFN